MIKRRNYSASIRYNDLLESDFDFCLLPYGYGLNVEILNACKGETISFADGEKFRIDVVDKLNLKSNTAEALCNIRYGVNITDLLGMWRQTARYNGYNTKAISDEECIFIAYGKENIGKKPTGIDNNTDGTLQDKDSVPPKNTHSTRGRRPKVLQCPVPKRDGLREMAERKIRLKRRKVCEG